MPCAVSKEEEVRVLYSSGYKRYIENLLRPRFDPSVSSRSPVIHTVVVDAFEVSISRRSVVLCQWLWQFRRDVCRPPRAVPLSLALARRLGGGSVSLVKRPTTYSRRWNALRRTVNG